MSMPSLHTFHAALRDGQREAGPLEARLAAAYHHVLNQYIEAAAAKLESAPGTLVAATNPQNPDQPGWTPPPAGTLVDVPALVAALRAETDPVRRKILEALVAATLDRFGISFDLSNPLLDGVFQQMGQNIQGIAETTRNDIMQAVQKSHDEGLSIPHAADEIRRVAAMSKTRAVTIARTELIGASNGASLAAARLTDAAPYKTWLSAGDHRVREAHRIADGQTVPIAAPFLVGGEPLMFPGDQLNGTPDETVNCRCLPGDVKVSGCVVEAAMRRPFEGQLVKVTTASGNSLTATSNHPVLTRRGWAISATLQPGDDLVRSTIADSATRAEPDVDDVPTSIEQVFAAAMLTGTRAQRIGSVDFHGEALLGKGEIDVVRPADHLSVEDVPAFREEFIQLAFALSKREMSVSRDSGPLRGVTESNDVSLASASWCNAMVGEREMNAAALNPIGAAQGKDALPAAVALHELCAVGVPARPVALAPRYSAVTADMPRLMDALIDGHRADADMASDFVISHSGLVEFDPVVNVELSAFRGHVYNLDTVAGCYLADGFVTANCTLIYTDQAPMAIAAGGDTMSTMTLPVTVDYDVYAASGLPIADRGRAWDAAAAKKRVKSWSGSTDTPNAKYKSAFFATNGDTYGDCHLPFADVINGTLTAIPRGIFAAAGAVNGSRGASGYDSAKSAIASYYAAMRRKFNDPKLTPPWQAASDALTYAMPTGLPVSDAPQGLEDITPGADWEATLLVEGSPTDDGRMIMPGATTWRTLPLTLMAMVETQPGHDGAVVAGRIDSIERVGQNIVARGVFDSGEFGQEIARLVKDETLRGISVDLAAKDVRATNSAGQELDLELAADAGDVYSTVFDGVVLGGTVCPMQAFADATIMTITASGTIGMALTAGAAGLVPLNPPSEWFDIPEPGEPTPLTVTEEGQVYGHAALWNTCHIGYPDECVPPPRSPSDYRFFHLGQVACSDNQTVTCGTVTLGTGHAPLSMSKSRAAEHYDNTGTAVADVRARDANLGVWVCGALRPDTPAERVRHLSAGKLSGDWRNIDGRLEMVGLLTVNVPGFPVPHPRAMVAAVMDGESHVESQEVTALVAAGILRDHPADVFEYQVNTLAALIDGGLETLITTIGDSGGERT